MRLLPSDPDIETLVGRIKNEDIDLQPDFQRGEVWSQPKQRRLIDSVLRDWHVPPIHVVQHPDTKKQDVLDGQQRLAAIRDFVNGLFSVDGKIEPIDAEIEKLDGLRYAELPPEWKRQFDQFTIRVFRIVDFAPEEPAELFFRLNQPVSLTSAEQRNAFFGPVRSQVKELVDKVDDVQFGFSNSRMALDDVVARVCLCVENQSIATKSTASKLTERYRAREPFSDEVLAICEYAVANFVSSAAQWQTNVKLNKATLFSWLWLSACASQHLGASTSKILAQTISQLEQYRKERAVSLPDDLQFPPNIRIARKQIESLLGMFNDRSSSRVSDVTSVVARDVVLWIFMGIAMKQLRIRSVVPYVTALEEPLREHLNVVKGTPFELVSNLIEMENWGELR